MKSSPIHILTSITKMHGPGLCKKYPSESTTYFGMKNRCINPKNGSWKHYGGRGIKVCPEWNTFAAFLKDMGPKPSKHHQLDRIDNNGNYGPDNCRWTTRKQQARNKTSNHKLTYKGRTLCIREWAEITKIPGSLIGLRVLRLKWTVVKALTLPAGGNTKKFTHKGETKSLLAWSKQFGIKHTTVLSRVKSGKSFYDALTSPIMSRTERAKKAQKASVETRNQKKAKKNAGL